MSKTNPKPISLLWVIAVVAVNIFLAIVLIYSKEKISPQIKRNEVKTVIYTVDKDAYDVAHYIGAINPADTLNTLEWNN